MSVFFIAFTRETMCMLPLMFRDILEA